VDSLELLGAHLFSGQISRKGPSRFGFPVSQPNIKFRFSPLGITPQLMLRSRSVALFPGNTDRIPLPVNRLIQIIITGRSVRTSPLTMEIRGLPQNMMFLRHKSNLAPRFLAGSDIVAHLLKVESSHCT
jgi:hypothetical protein